MQESPFLIQNNAVALGLLMVTLAVIFYSSSSAHPFWKKFYTFFPSLLLCYFVPALYQWPLGWIDGQNSPLYGVARDFLLPASLVLLCLSIDIKGILSLGPKALIMFLAATAGVILGGPIALITVKTFFPSLAVSAGPDLWKGMSTIAGSWIGGSANQTAMKEIYHVPQDLFGTMLIVDVIVANIWMAILLYGAGQSVRIDRWLKADNTAIEALRQKSGQFRQSVEKNPSTQDIILLMAVTFGTVGISHLITDAIMPVLKANEAWLASLRLSAIVSGFFWLVVIATTLGVALSFTPARKLEGVGASRWGSVFIYILVTTIGMQMNLKEVFQHLGLFAIGIIWMGVHVMIILLVARLIKAPFFFVAVGSQANIGGAASAPIVASAFDVSLAPVGVLLAVMGYALGTYGAILCAHIMGLI
ncbi:MAG: DUF819 family protein [Saprospiraceae bacterium]|jgi:uncharacterized membrane protein|nr:DUF819 family protein [Saprospiraceae bacterium]MBP9193312.1 DUF819 family protein [Saprospiraceae bacterium]